MRIVWDESKRVVNLDKHGLDFADLTPGFFAAATVVEAKRGRSLAVGEMDARILGVVFVPLGAEGLSVVSMRPASRKERRL